MKVVAIVLLLVAVASAKILPQRLQKNLADSSIVTDNTTAPFIVSIGNLPISNDHAGTGTIISKDWILTTASIVRYLESRPSGIIGLPVYAGVHDLSKVHKAQMRRIDFAFKNKESTAESGPYDIGLLHVSQPFDLSDSVKPVVLPAFNEEYIGQFKTYGWGQNENVYGKDLKVSVGEVMNATVCESAIPAYGPVIKKNVCVVVNDCYNARGSPLINERLGGIFELIGIASWTYLPCAYSGRPTAYTKVSSFIDWITEVQWAHGILHN